MFAEMSLKPMSEGDLKGFIRSIPDFPKPGISFKDITPLLSEPAAFRALVEQMSFVVKQSGAHVVVGLEARGFILGAAIALECGLPFVPARKPGKLPAEVVEERYDLEYGSAALQIHRDAIMPGAKVAVVDDLLATGGTAAAAMNLIRRIGADVATCVFAIELKDLYGREKLGEVPVASSMTY